MKNGTYLNILISYAYCTSKALQEMLISLTTKKKINMMIDSGAFTKFNAKGSTSHITLEKYCDFLTVMAPYSEKYVMLDVIGNASESHKNYEVMLRHGLNPMYVVTMFDKDYDYMRWAASNNPNLCVAGGATTKSDWMSARYQTIYRESNEKALIHGLAYVTFPKMLQLPLASVDSSSWKAGALRFGQFAYFDKGIKGFNSTDILKRGKKLTMPQIKALSELGVTPQMFAQEHFHRGNASIEALSAVKANVEMQKYCKRHGLNFFMAISNTQDLNKIVYVDENIRDLSYEKFRKEFAK